MNPATLLPVGIGNLAEIWVYLSATPLFGLTLLPTAQRYTQERPNVRLRPAPRQRRGRGSGPVLRETVG